MAASEQKRLFSSENVEGEASIAGCSSDTLVGGTQTYISSTVQNGFDAFVRKKSRRKSPNGVFVCVNCC